MSKTVFEKSAGVFLDLNTCGSSIRYGVSLKSYAQRYRRKPGEDRKKIANPKRILDFDFTICMTDCTRSISWNGGTPAEANKKLTRAIRMLQQAQAAVLRAQAQQRRLKKVGYKRGYVP